MTIKLRYIIVLLIFLLLPVGYSKQTLKQIIRHNISNNVNVYIVCNLKSTLKLVRVVWVREDMVKLLSGNDILIVPYDNFLKLKLGDVYIIKE